MQRQRQRGKTGNPDALCSCLACEGSRGGTGSRQKKGGGWEAGDPDAPCSSHHLLACSWPLWGRRLCRALASAASLCLCLHLLLVLLRKPTTSQEAAQHIQIAYLPPCLCLGLLPLPLREPPTSQMAAQCVRIACLTTPLPPCLDLPAMPQGAGRLQLVPDTVSPHGLTASCVHTSGVGHPARLVILIPWFPQNKP